MYWNYRILKETKNNQNEYRIIEVYYDEKNNIETWCDCTDSILKTDGYEDLKDTANHVLNAFDKPVLLLGENDKLMDVK